MVITNAVKGDPYPIDTLMFFMANMAWNSTMNTVEVRRMLNDRDDSGEDRIPFVVVCDAFQSETTSFADLVLPATTNPAYSLTVYNAKAGDYGLRVGLVWWIIGIILATGYFVFSYRNFAGKVRADSAEEGY